MLTLFKRRLPVDATCGRCKNAEESVHHALRSCPVAQDVWQALNFTWDLQGDRQSSSDTWIGSKIRELNQEQLQQHIITLWAIWNARNSEIHGEKRKPALEIARFVHHYIRDFTLAQQRTVEHRTSLPGKWNPPSNGLVKINFDGSFYQCAKRCGIGVVARDSEGFVLGAHVSSKTCVLDPFMAEAYAAVRAFQFAYEMGFTNVMFEGDSLSIIRSLKAKETDFSDVGTTLEELQIWRAGFHRYLFAHVGREGNMVAHSLSKYGLQLDEEQNWVEDWPHIVDHIILSESLFKKKICIVGLRWFAN
ncbi:hypothetical protein DITRI_Ditri18aG0025900 [Diplodiscus trichospermus]